jgi:hypothetical protein
MTAKTLSDVRPARRPYLDRVAEMKWLREHRHEYLGQWVLLWGERLLASGADPVPLLAQVRAQGFDRPLVVHVRDTSEPAMGGWQ